MLQYNPPIKDMQSLFVLEAQCDHSGQMATKKKRREWGGGDGVCVGGVSGK